MKKMYFNLRPADIIKVAVYALYAAVLICTVSSFLPAAGYKGAIPDLILCATVAVAYFEGERSAAVFGTAAGFALEAVGSVGFSILPVFYMLAGCVGALLFSRALQKHFGAYMLYTALFMLMRSIISIIYIQFSMPDYSIATAFDRVLLDEYGLTLVCAAIVFFATMGISRLLKIGGETGDMKM